MILITSFGEFLLYFIVIFILFSFYKKKKELLQEFFFLFGVVLGCPVLAAGEHVPMD